MSKFNIRDTVLITEGIHAGKTGFVSRIEEDGNYIVRLDEPDRLFGIRFNESAMEYFNPNYYAITEMATVVSVPKIKKDPAMRIEVNPDRNRKGNPYFKVLDTEKYQKRKSKVCRLHFFDSELEYHTGDGLLDWEIKKKDVEAIKKLLNKHHEDFPQYTNLQMSCWLWNLEYGFFVRKDRDDYMDGKLDDKHKDHQSYVPSTQEIPEEWIYDYSEKG